jgi:hypothetical protein
MIIFSESKLIQKNVLDVYSSSLFIKAVTLFVIQKSY